MASTSRILAGDLSISATIKSAKTMKLDHSKILGYSVRTQVEGKVGLKTAKVGSKTLAKIGSKTLAKIGFKTR